MSVTRSALMRWVGFDRSHDLWSFAMSSNCPPAAWQTDGMLTSLVLHVPPVCQPSEPKFEHESVKTSTTSYSGDSHASTEDSDIDHFSCQLNSEWIQRTKLCMRGDYCTIMVAGEGRRGSERRSRFKAMFELLAYTFTQCFLCRHFVFFIVVAFGKTISAGSRI